MLLTPAERLVLLKMLPAEGNLATIRTVRVLREALAFDSDIAEGKVRASGSGGETRLDWDDNYEKDIDLGRPAELLICGTLKSLDEQEKLTQDHVGLCEKFGL